TIRSGAPPGSTTRRCRLRHASALSSGSRASEASQRSATSPAKASGASFVRAPGGCSRRSSRLWWGQHAAPRRNPRGSTTARIRARSDGRTERVEVAGRDNMHTDEPNYYDTLQVSPDADQGVVQAAY